jgi:hypothetical protein
MPSNPKRDVIEKCVALKKLPHVYNKVKSVWGYPEFFETIDNLLMMEEGREGRSGFPAGAYKELDTLKQIFMKFPEQVMSPHLNEAERKKIMQTIEHIRTRVAFSTGDRR